MRESVRYLVGVAGNGPQAHQIVKRQVRLVASSDAVSWLLQDGIETPLIDDR